MGKLHRKKKLGQFCSPGAEQYFLRKKNMDRSIDLAVQHMSFNHGDWKLVLNEYICYIRDIWQKDLAVWLKMEQMSVQKMFIDLQIKSAPHVKPWFM